MARANPITRPVPLDGVWPTWPRIPGWLWVAWRIATCLGWTAICAPIQAVLLMFPGRAKVRLPGLYWAGCCWCLGLRVRVIGAPFDRAVPTIFIANHTSWLDIPALGSRLPACFISKGEVGQWPIISTVARLGRTVFVSRRVAGAARENAEIRRRLGQGDSLILFPEGTTSDGARVMPFRSAFLAIAETGQRPRLQPVSVVYDELDYLPVRRADRALFAWFGDMNLMSHFSRIARHRGLRVTIVLHPPIDAAGLTRKQLAVIAWCEVAMGAAALRRNPVGEAG